MDPQDRRTLLKALELAEENNVMLRKMWRSYRVGRAFRVFYWTAIIALSIGSYYFLQPYIESAKTTYTSIQGDLSNINAIRETFLKR